MAPFCIFFQNSETTFSKQICPIFYVLCTMLKNETQQILKMEHQCKISVKLALKKTKQSYGQIRDFFSPNSDTTF